MQNIHSPDQYEYKGMIIKRCCSAKSFWKPYYTVVNTHKKNSDGSRPHCHVCSEILAKQIIDYYINLDRYNRSNKKTNRSLRDKALCLTGIQVKITH